MGLHLWRGQGKEQSGHPAMGRAGSWLAGGHIPAPRRLAASGEAPSTPLGRVMGFLAQEQQLYPRQQCHPGSSNEAITPSSTQPPQNAGITSPHVISACRVPRQGGGREQLGSTLRYLNFSRLGTELCLGIRKQPGWQSSKVPPLLWCLPALLAGQSPAPSLPAKAQCRELSPQQHHLLSRHACASP